MTLIVSVGCSDSEDDMESLPRVKGAVMVVVPAGEFIRGSVNGEPDEKPV